jgi:Asp-tRNA(Asn)/Glu-tRNA(Gln) amidotransferase B subunit
MVLRDELNQNTARTVLAEMYATGAFPESIVEAQGLRQVSDSRQIAAWVQQVIETNPQQVQSYLAGKETVARWLFGQVMRQANGKANPQLVQQELERALSDLRSQQ